MRFRIDTRCRLWTFLAPERLVRLAELPLHHREPFDRHLVALAATLA